MLRRRLVVGLLAVAAVVGAALAVWRWRDRELRPPASAALIWSVRVLDGDGGAPIAARLLLFDEAGAALHHGAKDLYDGKRQARGSCALGPGAIGTWDGIVLADGTAELAVGADGCAPSPSLPPGRYHGWAWRGIEYDRAEFEVDLTVAGPRVESVISLRRAFTPVGTLAADLHVHAARSNDSGVPDEIRVMTQLAAGIEVVGLSDHNSNGDLREAIAAVGAQDRIVSIASTEASVGKFHLGIYPVEVSAGPRGGAPAEQTLEAMSPEELFGWARALPGRPVIQVNHPRFRYAALFDSFGWDGKRWPPPFPTEFDAFEVLSGHTAFNVKGDRRIDESVRDAHAFWNHGLPVTALGNSDTHHLNGVLDALTRTYVMVDRGGVAPFDEAGFLASLRAQRALATSGPWIEVEVAPAKGVTPTAGIGGAITAVEGKVQVTLDLAWPNFAAVDEVRIVVGGTVVYREALVASAGAHRLAREVGVGRLDSWLSVEVSGEQPLPIELTGTYQIEKGREGVTPFALTNPIYLDVDGDGVVRIGDFSRAVPGADRE